ncbi:hypothetical protein OQA88_12276 [Cercophora sp. LCS_1]
MNRRIECRSEGCQGEVLFKTVEGIFPDAPDGRRRAPVDRGSPTGYHRHSTGATQIMSPYCKQHTCAHFFREEGCNNKKPPHDQVCAVHARCPFPDCVQARGQFLDPKYDYVPGMVPRYMRYELCFDHKCTVRQCQRQRTGPKAQYCASHGCQAEGCANLSQENRNCCENHECAADGCRTIVEGGYPYCVIHIKCDIKACNMARHHIAKTDEYLNYCTEHVTCEANRCRGIKTERSPFCADHTCRERGCDRSCHNKPYCNEHVCAEPSCEFPKPLLSTNKFGKFCPMHTCRERNCRNFVDSTSLYCRDHSCSITGCLYSSMAETLCITHFKEEYMNRGERDRRAKQSAARERTYGRSYYAPHDLGTSTESETATETESDNEKDNPANSAPHLFQGSNLSNNSKKRDGPSTKGNSRGTWPRGSTFSGNTTTSGGKTSATSGTRTAKPKGGGGWADGPSPRSSVTSRMEPTESLVVEDGEYPAGFDEEHPVVTNGHKQPNGKRVTTAAGS